MSKSVIAANKSIGFVSFQSFTPHGNVGSTPVTFTLFSTNSTEYVDVHNVLSGNTSAFTLKILDNDLNEEYTLLSNGGTGGFTFNKALQEYGPYSTQGTSSTLLQVMPQKIIIPPNCTLKLTFTSFNSGTIKIKGIKYYTSP